MHLLTRSGPARGRFRPALGALAAAGALATAVVTALPTGAPAAVPAASATVVTISPTTTGTALSASAPGLSFEASDLALPAFGSGDLAAYLKTLGSSVMRVGGNTVDETFWTSTGATAPSWSIATITPADLTALATLAEQSGWKVILGVNLKQYSPSRAADEAAHAVAALGTSLQAIEIGNEPDRYPQYESNPAQYPTDFEAYVSAIRAAAPGVPIEGTDAAGAPGGSFQQAFVAQQAALAAPQITELTSHYYPLRDCSSSDDPTIAQLLGTTVRDNEKSAADAAVAAAGQLRVPAVIDEGNSVVCEGMPGVSDVYAAALWEIDDQLVDAREGAAGDYMHGTILQCDTGKPLFMYYTPLCAPTAADASAGDLAAQPEYYGLAAVHAIGAGDFLNLVNPAWADLRAYAVRHANGTMTVVLDDVDDPSTTGSTALQIALGASYGTGQVVTLASAGGLTARGGITLGGQTVQADGTLPAPTATPITVDGSTLNVTVPAGTAQLITLTPSGAATGTTTTLVGGLSGKCLSVTGASTANGATAEIYTCNGSASESWTLNPNGTVVGGLSGKCLEVAGGSTAALAGVDISTCTGAANQQWSVTTGGTVVGVQSGKCLSVTGASTANYATADMYTCNGSGSETWHEVA